jgi:hypothetical protein
MIQGELHDVTQVRRGGRVLTSDSSMKFPGSFLPLQDTQTMSSEVCRSCFCFFNSFSNSSSFKCLAPSDLSSGRSECKDAQYIHRIYTRSDHLEGFQTYNPSKSSPSTSTISPSTNLPSTSLRLHYHNLHGIIHHLLALVDSSWLCLIR